MRLIFFFKNFLSIILTFILFTAPVYAGANVAVKGEGDEVPSYVRSDITGYDFHGEDLHLSSIAGAVKSIKVNIIDRKFLIKKINLI